ncbi:hypothetical protein CKM354_001298600 [Cercospora kikuchii]|uniref:Uncharacterized protein n=1 Tax=Cercospora kikuchii TaxID=84275 RepID=A0A9P3FN27_9PEZI|nr:uncharacterized protein CKM354_001298600 [Cercospora kikuchii]GIZ49971.1 hypothetical protein CKM354_001298600 [Cercospora kikuchii]
MLSPPRISQDPDLLNLAGAGALFPLTLGTICIFSPSTGFRIFGFPEPVGTPQARKRRWDMMFCFGSRDVFFGLSALAAWHEGAGRVLGWLYLCGALMAVADGIHTAREFGGGAWKNIVWCPILVAIGGGLLEWFDQS